MDQKRRFVLPQVCLWSRRGGVLEPLTEDARRWTLSNAILEKLDGENRTATGTLRSTLGVVPVKCHVTGTGEDQTVVATVDLGPLLGSTAHELNNRLFVARSSVEFAQEDGKNGDVSALVDAHQAIEESLIAIQFCQVLACQTTRFSQEFRIDQAIASAVRVLGRHVGRSRMKVKPGAPALYVEGDVAELFAYLYLTANELEVRGVQQILISAEEIDGACHVSVISAEAASEPVTTFPLVIRVD